MGDVDAEPRGNRRLALRDRDDRDRRRRVPIDRGELGVVERPVVGRDDRQRGRCDERPDDGVIVHDIAVLIGKPLVPLERVPEFDRGRPHHLPAGDAEGRTSRHWTRGVASQSTTAPRARRPAGPERGGRSCSPCRRNRAGGSGPTAVRGDRSSAASSRVPRAPWASSPHVNESNRPSTTKSSTTRGQGRERRS